MWLFATLCRCLKVVIYLSIIWSCKPNENRLKKETGSESLRMLKILCIKQTIEKHLAKMLIESVVSFIIVTETILIWSIIMLPMKGAIPNLFPNALRDKHLYYIMG